MAEQLLSGGVKTLILKLINIGAMFLVSVLLARSLGAEEYGSYIFVFTLVGLLSEPVFLGLRTVAVRNSAIYLQQRQYGLLLGLSQRLRHFMYASGTAAALLLLVIAWLMRDKMGSDNNWIFLFGAALPFLLGLNRIRDGILRGAGAVLTSQVPKLIVRPLLLLLFISIAWLLLEQAFDARWAMAMQVLAAASAGLLYSFLLRRQVGSQLQAQPAEYKTKEWFRGVIPLATSGIFQILDARIGILLIGVLLTSSETGVYHAAFRLAELIVLAHASANVVFEPHIARLYSANKIDELQRKITMVARVVFAASIPVAIVMVTTGEWLLSFFGLEFTQAAPALSILALSQLVNAGLGSPAMLLNMTHRAKVTAGGLLLGVVVNLVLNLALIPWLGIIGTAWAALGSMLVTKVYLMVRAQQLLGIHTSVLGAYSGNPLARSGQR